MKKTKKIVIANWKMNPPTLAVARALFDEANKLAKKLVTTSVVLLPPAVYLPALGKLKTNKRLFLGAQNAFFEEKGAYTGELSAAMLGAFGARYLLVGHSERRRFGETDADVSRKVETALKHGYSIVVCVGESERDQHGNYMVTI
jgi:triosephosphate isomerase (TIM)